MQGLDRKLCLPIPSWLGIVIRLSLTTKDSYKKTLLVFMILSLNPAELVGMMSKILETNSFRG